MTTIHGTVDDSIALSQRAGEYQLFSWVPDHEVPFGHRVTCGARLNRLAKHYELGPMRVRFFGPPRPGRIHELPDGSIADRGDFWCRATEDHQLLLGVAPDDQPDVVALHVGMAGFDLIAHTIAHEVRHVMQRRAGVAKDEDECNRFADAWVLSGEHRQRARFP